MFTLNRWYRRDEFLIAWQFMIAARLPVKQVIPELPIPKAKKHRLLQSLNAGVSFQEALINAGVPPDEATSIGGISQGRIHIPPLTTEHLKMSRDLLFHLVQLFAYPNVVAVLSVAGWFYLSVLQAPASLVIQLMFASTLAIWAGLQIVLFTATGSRFPLPVFTKIHLFRDGFVLFSFLKSAFASGMDETTALQAARTNLGVQRAIGRDSVGLVASGKSFIEVLGVMPVTRALRFGTAETHDVLILIDHLTSLSKAEWKKATDRSLSSIRTISIVLSGFLLLWLAVRSFSTAYAPPGL